MRVGIDARLVHLPGVGRYIRCLLAGLGACCGEFDPVIYMPPDTGLLVPDLEVHQVRVPPFSIAEQAYWPIRIARDHLHIFHSPHFVFPLATPCQLVVTLHDMVYFRYPPQGTRFAALRLYYFFANHMAALRANAIITDSTFSRMELSHYLKVSMEKVVVVPIAVESHMRSQAEDVCRSFRDRYRLPSTYILYVGTNKPWKNLEVLLKGFAEANRARPDCTLVIAGKRGRNEESPVGLINELGIEKQVAQIGEVHEVDMPALYSAARMVVCPSLYEGFGLTALEAMACGAPVISSTAASLPEVVGDAAMLVDPLDVFEWANAMIRLWDDTDLQVALCEAGLTRAKQFTVENMADGTMAVYKRLCSSEATV